MKQHNKQKSINTTCSKLIHLQLILESNALNFVMLQNF